MYLARVQHATLRGILTLLIASTLAATVTVFAKTPSVAAEDICAANNICREVRISADWSGSCGSGGCGEVVRGRTVWEKAPWTEVYRRYSCYNDVDCGTVTRVSCKDKCSSNVCDSKNRCGERFKGYSYHKDCPGPGCSSIVDPVNGIIFLRRPYYRVYERLSCYGGFTCGEFSRYAGCDICRSIQLDHGPDDGPVDEPMGEAMYFASTFLYSGEVTVLAACTLPTRVVVLAGAL